MDNSTFIIDFFMSYFASIVKGLAMAKKINGFFILIVNIGGFCRSVRCNLPCSIRANANYPLF